MKQCNICNVEKPYSDFYAGILYADGYQKRCKSCVKRISREKEIQLSKTPEGLESLRQRSRDKYHRLGYKDKYKGRSKAGRNSFDSKRPWRNSSIIKNLSRKLKIPKGMEGHHWNYSDEYLTDVIIMNTNTHKTVHRLITLDIERKIFKSLEGVYLNTKEEHINYLKLKGICL